MWNQSKSALPGAEDRALPAWVEEPAGPVGDFLSVLPIEGTPGPDSLAGDRDGPADEILLGGDGPDTLRSAAGIDVIDGGSGTDLAIIDRGGVSQALAFALLAGAGTLLGDGTTVTGIESVSLAGGLGDDSLKGGDSFDSLWGGGGSDTLDGGGSSDFLQGDAASDEDWTGAPGADLLIGGAGNDFLVGDLPGGGFADTILGGDGADRLDGGGGADSLVGGAGDDTYAVDDAGDITIEEENGGQSDLVEARIGWTLAPWIERLVLTGKEGLAGTGNGLGNDITGTDGADTLNGASGNDSLVGRDGDDRLWGADGDDRAAGNDGEDSIGGAAGRDTLLGDDGRDSLWGGEGDDSLTGGDDDDLLYGDVGADTLNGGKGADTLLGDAGDDTYLLYDADDAVIESGDPSGGVDTVRIWVSHTLGFGLENLVMGGSVGLSGTGNSRDNVLTGNTGGNLLAGMGGADTIIGNWGNDTLVGGAGTDRLEGQVGADLIRFAAPSEGGDTIVGFNGAEDLVEVCASGFGRGLAAGMDLIAGGRYLEGAGIAQGTTPVGTGQFLFRTDQALLLWDPDGAGTLAPVPIALLAGVVGWSAADLVVVA